jgi:Arc/MetJ-type ribon-helix-helix transcriptional regulator
MKLSVSLPEEDVAYLDQYVEQNPATSRSAALHEAIKLLRLAALESAYEDAYAEWEASEDAALWDGTTADGLNDAAR